MSWQFMEGLERKTISRFAPKISFFCPILESILRGVSQKAKNNNSPRGEGNTSTNTTGV